MRSIALELSVFPCASFFSDTVPPPPRLLWRRKLSAQQIRELEPLDRPKAMPSKCFFTRFGRHVLHEDRIVFRLPCDDSHIARIAFVARPRVGDLDQLDLHGLLHYA